MLQLRSIVNVCDRTGIMVARCVKFFGARRIQSGYLGDIILVSVLWLNSKRIALLKPRLQRRFIKGSLHRALILRIAVNFMRFQGVFIKFNENSIIIVNRKRIPVTNRIYGPVLREFCIKWPWLGSITRTLI